MTLTENTTETVTLRQFFASLDIGQKVQTRNNSHFIYAGNYAPQPEQTAVPTLVSVNYADVTYTSTDLDEPNDGDWEIDSETVDLTTRRLVASLVSKDIGIRTQEREVRRLQDENRTFRTDFETVNEKINEYANGQDMCEDYEHRIFGWNNELTALKLIGRLRDYDVNFSINGEGSFWISCEARSPELARQEVSEMSGYEILRKVVERGDVDDLTIEVYGWESE
jgi:hypothetical protein